LKAILVGELQQAGYEVVDHGAATYDASDDYPGFCIACAQGVVDDLTGGVEALGVVLGGSGNGEQLAANLVKGARAVLVTHIDLATLGRLHNNANIIAIGARFTAAEFAIELVKTFLTTPFSEEARHVRRLQQMADFEVFGKF
ncbi:MAG: RpiB/LacA/LacB family sugar-phosphate isomerase, partial [Propionibacteriaceae bacterium]|nr:RpiB/LacA/LacB family sugar-phosphate isomerase [Propionibacteriaceae bacterium]